MTDPADSPMDPAWRARLSLEGLAVGDAFGETLFRYRSQVRAMAGARTPAPGPWPWTDDTAMAISIVEELEERGAIDQDALAARFGRRYRAEPARGYGGSAHQLLEQISRGKPWRPAARGMFGGTGSYGNGSAMRVAPIGAWFADDLDAVAVQAARSAEVTHAHPEGRAGAIAVAVAAALAWRTRADPWDGAAFLAAVIERTPPSETRTGIESAARLPAGTSPEDAAAALGCGRRVSAQDTVPFSLWCAAQDPDDFEGTLWTTGRGLGDVDTTCAIVGGITVLRTGGGAIPGAWLDAREPLPARQPSRSGQGKTQPGEPAPLDRRAFDAAVLMAQHPPRLYSPNKQVVLEVACPPGAVHRGTIGYSRWAAMALPELLDGVPADLVLASPGFFDYRPALEGGDVAEWHLNFADPRLFAAYAGGLFAQDEVQVAEHPALGSLKQALEAAGVESRTDGPAGPTPVLVTGVERRVAVATSPDAASGRPHGLYGNAFAAAAPDAVRRATTPVDPPTVTNLVAIAATAGGRGPYSGEEIRRTLVTAFTGFRAAVLESARLAGGPARVVVHTGYWGCGAFGGNRVLMAALQVLAARMAGLERLAFHIGSPGGDTPLADARSLITELTGSEAAATADLLAAIEARGFRWGVSDGN